MSYTETVQRSINQTTKVQKISEQLYEWCEILTEEVKRLKKENEELRQKKL